MQLRRTLAALVLAGSLTACGGPNTDLERGETNCDELGEEGQNEQDSTCDENT